MNLAEIDKTSKLWMDKASKDIRVARHLIDVGNDDFLENAIFLCQQAVEKAIKGFLAKNKIRFDKTHNIKVLLSLVLPVNEKLAEGLKPCEILTKYAVAIRYPEETGEQFLIDRTLALNTYKLANWAFEELKNAGVNQ